ncbi:unnamed protein product, partial [Leptidea sinapis]
MSGRHLGGAVDFLQSGREAEGYPRATQPQGAVHEQQPGQGVERVQQAASTLELPNLEDLLFVGNPLYDACELEVWRAEAARRLPALRKLDGENVLREDDPPITVADMQ